MGDFRSGFAALLIAALAAWSAPVEAQRSTAVPDAPPAAATMRVPGSELRTAVPRLEGAPMARVDALLEAARLRRGATRYESRAGPAGVVVGQSPAAGTLLGVGSAVDVVVSVAPAPPERTAPAAADRSPAGPAGDPGAAAILGVIQGILKAAPPPRTAEPRPGVAEPPPAAPPAPPSVADWDVVVPNLVGQTLASQAALLRDRRLGVASVTERDATRPAGIVLAQSPPGGTRVRPGSSIDVVVSRGPPPRVAVPDVVGLDEARANERLAARRLPAEARVVASTEADGVVLSQAPAAGRAVAPGTAVQLRVSDGSLVVVPALVGATAATAAERLEAASLRAEAEARESDAPPGQVLAQEPSAGSTVRRGSSVRFWRAAAARVTVPDLAGLTQAEAIERLGTALPAEARTIDSTEVPEGRIAAQDPAPRTLVDAGTTVRVDVSRGPPPLADLTGMTPEQARTAAAQAGTSLGEPQRAFDPAPSGTVIGQTPAAGSRVPPGVTVTPRISRGPLWPWVAAGAATTTLVLLGAAAALWTPVRYRVRLEATPADRPAAEVADGAERRPALALRVRLERGAPMVVEPLAAGVSR